MTELQLKIITKAVEIRMENDEKIDTILSSYPKLNDDEKNFIKDTFSFEMH